MVGTASEKREQQLLSMRLIGIVVRFKRHKNGVDFGELIRIANLQRPALLRFVIYIQNSQTFDRRRIRLPLAPGLVRVFRVDDFALVEIESIKTRDFPSV